MTELIFTGNISNLSEVKSFTTQTGAERRYRDMVITTNEQYPQSLIVNIRRDSLLNLPFANGQEVTAHLSVRTHTGKDGRIYNDIEAWRIDF